MEENYQKRGYLLEDYRLFHLRDQNGTNVDMHFHEFDKLIFLLAGNGHYFIDGSKYELLPGDLLLIGNNVIHKPQFDPGICYDRFIVYIRPEFLIRSSTPSFDLENVFFSHPVPVLRPDEAVRKNLGRLLAQMEREMAGDAPEKEILSRCTLFRILVEANRAFSLPQDAGLSPVMPKDAKVLEILQYLDENLAEEVSIDDLSHRFFISKYHMMRRFREETGTSIHNYLSERRLIMARDLIRKGESATNACFRSGFRSYSAFSRAYGKLFGVTPTGRNTAETILPEQDE